MKRSPLKSYAYLERRTPMSRTWMKKRRARRMDRIDHERLVNDFDGNGPRIEVVEGHSEDRLDFVRRRPCVVCWREPTDEQPNHACHEGQKPGLALKCPDSETFAMCSDCHRAWTEHYGFSRGWSAEARRSFAEEHYSAAHSAYLAHGSRRAA